jgi:hypothetical protein
LSNPYQGGYAFGEVFFEGLDGASSWGDQKAYDASFSQLTKEYDWSWHNERLYVYAPSDPDERYAAVEAPQRASCVRLPEVPHEDYVEYVAFDNLTLMYAMRHGFYPGYNEIEAHGLRLTNCHIGYIGVKGGSSAYCIAAWHSDMLIQNNVIHDCGRRGISLNTYTDYTPGLTISNVTIDNNHFYNGYHTTSADISTLPGREHTFTNFTISNNLIDDSNRRNSGIHEGCYASSCTSNSIYVAANDSHYADFYIYNNVIVDSTSRAMLLVDMDSVHVYHNTVYGSHPDAQPYGLVIFNNVASVDMRNNVFHGTLIDVGDHNYGRCVLDENSTTFAARDHNLYYQEDPGQPITGSEHGYGGWDVFMDEWEAWRAGSGFETHSPGPQDPLLVDPENGAFNLQAESSAVDAGVLISGFNDAYNGAAPDLGAFEFTPSLTLHGTPADRAINLAWTVNSPLPPSTTWHIAYYVTPTQVFTATDPFSTTRAYTLTGLENYEWYTVTLDAKLDASTLFSDTVTVMPTDISVYLPIVLR